VEVMDGACGASTRRPLPRRHVTYVTFLLREIHSFERVSAGPPCRYWCFRRSGVCMGCECRVREGFRVQGLGFRTP